MRNGLLYQLRMQIWGARTAQVNAQPNVRTTQVLSLRAPSSSILHYSQKANKLLYLQNSVCFFCMLLIQAIRLSCSNPR